jgi:hypothetical protein
LVDGHRLRFTAGPDGAGCRAAAVSRPRSRFLRNRSSGSSRRQGDDWPYCLERFAVLYGPPSGGHDKNVELIHELKMRSPLLFMIPQWVFGSGTPITALSRMWRPVPNDFLWGGDGSTPRRRSARIVPPLRPDRPLRAPRVTRLGADSAQPGHFPILVRLTRLRAEPSRGVGTAPH